MAEINLARDRLVVISLSCDHHTKSISFFGFYILLRETRLCKLLLFARVIKIITSVKNVYIGKHGD